MDRRDFLLGVGGTVLGGTALGACAKPERDLLESYEGVDIPLQPGVIDGQPVPTVNTVPEGTGGPANTPMQNLIASVPEADRPGLSFTARANVASIDVEAEPGDGVAAWTFANPIESGGDLVFLVDDYDGVAYYRVLLPVRPNGSFGWIRIDQADLLRHNFLIRIELDEFRLTLFDHDERVFETVVGVARENAPTPLGTYYTTELIQPIVPNTIYGIYAYGLSGYSETFTAFNGGPGQLGVHGTNDPDTIGTNVSAGCIRLSNDDIAALVEDFKVPIGVPVEVI